MLLNTKIKLIFHYYDMVKSRSIGIFRLDSILYCDKKQIHASVFYK